MTGPRFHCQQVGKDNLNSPPQIPIFLRHALIKYIDTSQRLAGEGVEWALAQG